MSVKHILFILFLCIGCGKIEHEVVGETRHVIELDLIEFEAAFRNECEELHENQEDIDECVEEKISELITVINNSIEEENAETDE